MQTAQRPLVEDSETSLDLERLELIALWLDRRFLDPALGLFLPGAGNTIGALVGLYGVYVALRLSIHPIVVARMLINLAIDSVVGGIPFFGTIFDLFYRAHVKNLALIKERGSYGAPTTADWVVVLGAAFLFFIALLLPVILVGALIVFLAKTFF